MSALLATHGLTAFYGDFQALFGIDFEIDAGEAVGIEDFLDRFDAFGGVHFFQCGFKCRAISLRERDAEEFECVGEPVYLGDQRLALDIADEWQGGAVLSVNDGGDAEKRQEE